MAKKPAVAKKDSKLVMKTKDDMVFNKILWMFGIAVVVELLLLVVYKMYVKSDVATIVKVYYVLRNLTVVGGVGVAVGVIWAVAAKKTGKSRFGIRLAVASGLCSLACLFMNTYYPNGTKVLCAVVPVLALLALIYFLYQRDFFVSAVLSGIGIFVLWFFRKGFGSEIWMPMINVLIGVFAALLVLGLILTIVLRRKKGVMTLAGKQVTAYPANANYALLFFTYGLVAAAVLAAFFLGTTFAYYAIFMLVGYLFVLAVYYTVKMM